MLCPLRKGLLLRISALLMRFSNIIKSDAASGFSLLSTIAEDLKSLEDGVVMFSAEDNEYVLVVAPVLWIEADYPCHSGLWCSWSNHFVSLSKILYAHY